MTDGAHLRPWDQLSPECREAVENLFEFLDSELPETDGDRIREHIAACERCLAEYDLEDHLRQLVRRSCSEHAPERLRMRIKAQIAVLRGQLD